MPLNVLIFPDQLIRSSTKYPKDTVFFMVEDARFFRAFRFHKQKLIFHRASMQAFRERLLIKGYAVHYCDTVEHATLASAFRYISNQGVSELSYFSITNHTQRTDLMQQAKRFGISLQESPSPNFLDPKLPAKLPSEATAYALIRQDLNILMDGTKPRGGQWEYPAQKSRIRNLVTVPTPPETELNRYIEDAAEYVGEHFPRNPGYLENLHFPVTFADSEDWLDLFIDERLEQYGSHSQCLHPDAALLYNSGLSLLLDVCLITPQEVLERANERLRMCLAPLHSVERLYRGMIGSREYARAMYLRNNIDAQGVPVPRMLLEGKTDILPVDTVIQRLLQTGYANSSEREYILAAFAVLLELSFDVAVSWFASLTLDATAYSLIPNLKEIYDNPKSSILTSDKLCALSGYEKGEWCELWDALRARFFEPKTEGVVLRPFGESNTAKAESYIHTFTRN